MLGFVFENILYKKSTKISLNLKQEYNWIEVTSYYIYYIYINFINWCTTLSNTCTIEKYITWDTLKS